MKTRNFSFDLPEELIAQNPPEERGTCRLMLIDRGDDTLGHYAMGDFPDLVEPGTLVVFNDSRVRKGRIFAGSETGGKVEFLFLEPRDSDLRLWRVTASSSRRQRVGKRYELPEAITGTIVAEDPPYKVLELSQPIDDGYFERAGHVPLPPYIRREDTPEDEKRYQTVYGIVTGSIASPTAGLHFTRPILNSLVSKGAGLAYVTLHVGLGTFRPIRSEHIEEHEMHTERYSMPRETATAINRAKAEGRPVLAVGTTVVRTLESAAAGGDFSGAEEGLNEDRGGSRGAGSTAFNTARVDAGEGETNLFIRPGYRFRIVDQLMTNFHTPESSLIVMVSAFAGTERIKRAYTEAVDKRYMFFSYGDAMLIR